MSRTWLPAEYQDGWDTPPRRTPNEWVERTDDGAFVLGRRDCGDGIAHGRVLRDGNVVKFDWAGPDGHGQVAFVFQDGQFVERQPKP